MFEEADPADNTLPVEGYGPAATVRGEELYYTQSADLIYRAIIFPDAMKVKPAEVQSSQEGKE